MTGRALLNLAETHLYEGLSPAARDQMHRCIHDPAGVAQEQQEQTRSALLEAGGEIDE